MSNEIDPVQEMFGIGASSVVVVMISSLPMA